MYDNEPNKGIGQYVIPMPIAFVIGLLVGIYVHDYGWWSILYGFSYSMIALFAAAVTTYISRKNKD